MPPGAVPPAAGVMPISPYVAGFILLVVLVLLFVVFRRAPEPVEAAEVDEAPPAGRAEWAEVNEAPPPELVATQPQYVPVDLNAQAEADWESYIAGEHGRTATPLNSSPDGASTHLIRGGRTTFGDLSKTMRQTEVDIDPSTGLNAAGSAF